MNTQTKTELPLLTLILMISFASVNAVLFTPALPDITQFFNISNDTAQQTISLFLVGYTLGQLVYGPIANRFGRKHALYTGVCLQIISSLLCALAGLIQEYYLLTTGRFLLALGSGVGLNMAITLVSECYEPKTAAQKTSYLLLAFAITPGLSVAMGGLLNTYYSWISCFYASAIYGFILLLLLTRLPETLKTPDLHALRIKNLITGYSTQFKNIQLIGSGLMIGGMTSFFYVFAAVAPFIAIKTFGMSSEQYGFSNLLPPIGLLLGSLCSAHLAKKHPPAFTIKMGILITISGVLLMLIAVMVKLSVLFFLFLPMIVVYFGLSLIPANVTTMTMKSINDKANASAVMSFTNMSLATIVALNIGLLPITTWILPSAFFALCCFMIVIYTWVIKK